MRPWTFASLVAIAATPALADGPPAPRGSSGSSSTPISPAGYQVEVADVNGDKRPDIVALGGSTLAWYENPSWKKRVVSTAKETPDIISSATARPRRRRQGRDRHRLRLRDERAEAGQAPAGHPGGGASMNRGRSGRSSRDPTPGRLGSVAVGAGSGGVGGAGGIAGAGGISRPGRSRATSSGPGDCRDRGESTSPAMPKAGSRSRRATPERPSPAVGDLSEHPGSARRTRLPSRRRRASSSRRSSGLRRGRRHSTEEPAALDRLRCPGLDPKSGRVGGT